MIPKIKMVVGALRRLAAAAKRISARTGT